MEVLGDEMGPLLLGSTQSIPEPVSLSEATRETMNRDWFKKQKQQHFVMLFLEIFLLA
jgi:hypothetical protein